jgi:hypothetical protein
VLVLVLVLVLVGSPPIAFAAPSSRDVIDFEIAASAFRIGRREARGSRSQV